LLIVAISLLVSFHLVSPHLVSPQCCWSQDVYVVLRNSLKEMMTPELASRTLQLYTGLMEDFFGLPARAPEVRICRQWLHLLPFTS
jgi:hypothetical protein